MEALTVVARGLAEVAAENGRWMTWNLALAAIPAALAVVLFRYRGQRSAVFAVIWLCHGATRALVRHGVAASGSTAAFLRRMA